MNFGLSQAFRRIRHVCRPFHGSTLARIGIATLMLVAGASAQATILTSPEHVFDLSLNVSAAPVGNQSRSALATFDSFDSTLGNLTRVTVMLASAYSSSMNVEGENQSPQSNLEVRGDYYGELRLQFVDAPLNTLGGFVESTSMDASCSAGFPGTCMAQGWDSRSPAFSMDFDPAFFAAFEFPVDIEIANFASLSVNSVSNFGGLGNGSADSNWNGVLYLTYEYSPSANPVTVPEPSTLALLLGVPILAWTKRLLRRLPAREIHP